MAIPRPPITKNDVERFLVIMEWNRNSNLSMEAIFKSANVPASPPTWTSTLIDLGLIHKEEGKKYYRVVAGTDKLPTYVEAFLKAWKKPIKKRKSAAGATSTAGTTGVIPIALEKRLGHIENTLVRFADKLESIHGCLKEIEGAMCTVESAEEIGYVNNAVLGHLLKSLGEVHEFVELTRNSAIRKGNRINAEPNAMGIFHDQLLS